MVIASIHRLFRESLAHALSQEPDIEVIGGADSGPTAIKTALAVKPDILILDTRISDLNGIEVARQIISQPLEIKIIVLSEAAVPHYIWKMINLGVTGYLLKSSAFREMKKAVHLVAAGELYLAPEVAGILVKRIAAIRFKKSSFSLLSGREREVLQLIAEGYGAGDIAKKLYISPKTVQIHQSNLKKKLNLATTAELTKYAVSKGITPLDFVAPHQPKLK